VQLERHLPLYFIACNPQLLQLETFPEQVPQTVLHKSQVPLIVLKIVIPEGQIVRQFAWYKKVPFTHEIHDDALLQAKQGYGHGKQLKEALA
jgi:hypothetical protein